MTVMHTHWICRLRFLKRHLLMVLMAFGWLLIQSQVAVASHDCDVNVQGESMMLQHMAHWQTARAPVPAQMMSAPLCDKHCVPDVAQKDTGHAPLVAIPATLAVAVTLPHCDEIATSAWSLTPPAVGPPTTIRFCRFRE